MCEPWHTVPPSCVCASQDLPAAQKGSGKGSSSSSTAWRSPLPSIHLVPGGCVKKPPVYSKIFQPAASQLPPWAWDSRLCIDEVPRAGVGTQHPGEEPQWEELLFQKQDYWKSFIRQRAGPHSSTGLQDRVCQPFNTGH